MLRKPNRCSLLCVCAVMLLGSIAPLLAKDDPPPNPNASLFKAYSIAFIPFNMETGEETTRDKVEPAFKSTFEALGFTVVTGLPVLNAIKTTLGETVVAAGGGGFGLLPEDGMSRVGRVLGVRYVVCGNLTVKSKRIIIWSGPRVKATAALKTTIVDVSKGKTIFSTAVEADSKANVNGQIITIAILGPLGWVIGGIQSLLGSLANHEGKALTNCFIKAYDPFFVQLKNAVGDQTPTQ